MSARAAWRSAPSREGALTAAGACLARRTGLGAARLPRRQLLAVVRLHSDELPAVPGAQRAPALAMLQVPAPAVALHVPLLPALGEDSAREDELLAERLHGGPGEQLGGLRLGAQGREDERPAAHRSGGTLTLLERPSSTSTSRAPSRESSTVIRTRGVDSLRKLLFGDGVVEQLARRLLAGLGLGHGSSLLAASHATAFGP